MKHDIVYILKTDYINHELQYSIRSVIENFPYRNIWFVAGQPNELMPDARLKIIQRGDTKWERVRNSFRAICECKDITDGFWLFNDDFFILKPWDLGPAVYNDTLAQHIAEIENRHRGRTAYTKQLRECEQQLKEHGYGTLNYAIHCPMLINKEQMLQALDIIPECPMIRSIYGNVFNIGGIDHDDCKIMGMNEPIPDDVDFVSTEDRAFDYGAVGAQIRNRFKDKSRYEI